MALQQQKYKDFGPRNLALIAGAVLVLGVLAWTQRPVRSAAIKNGTGLGTGLAISSTDSQVLGASSYNEELIKQFEPIDIKTSADNSSDAFNSYIAQINLVKTADNLDLLLNGNVSQRGKDKQVKFIADLKRIAAPTVLADFHKLLLAYYQLRFDQQSSLSSEDYASYVAAVGAQLDQIRIDFNTSAGINLP